MIDVAQASEGHAGIPVTMDEVIGGGAEAVKALQGLVEQPAANWLLNEQDLKPGPCVGTPENSFASG